MKLSQLKIDPEFQSKIPPLQFEEEQQLEQNIIAEGRLLNPIITCTDRCFACDSQGRTSGHFGRASERKRQTERGTTFQTEAGASATKARVAETAGTAAERGARSTGAGDTLPTGGGNRTCQQWTTQFSSEDTGAQAPSLGGGHGTVEGIGGQPISRPHRKKWFHYAVRVARRCRGFYVPMGHYFPELPGCFNQ